jgi:hypothetical protein
MKILRVIGHVKMELASTVSEAVFVSIIRSLCDINNYIQYRRKYLIQRDIRKQDIPNTI